MPRPELKWSIFTSECQRNYYGFTHYGLGQGNVSEAGYKLVICWVDGEIDGVWVVDVERDGLVCLREYYEDEGLSYYMVITNIEQIRKGLN